MAQQDRAGTAVKFVKFSVIGALSALCFVVIYVALREVWPPAAANLIGLLGAVVLNTEANRRWTFERSQLPWIRMHLKGAALILVAYVFTTGAVLLLRAVYPEADRLAEATVVVFANAAMAVFRFVGLDLWALRPAKARRDGTAKTGPPSRSASRVG